MACAGVALALSAAARPARGGPQPATPWWRSPSVQATISLTPEQVKRLEAIHAESLPERRRLREQLTGLQTELDRVLADGLDDQRASVVIERVFEAEKQRNIARTMLLLRMYRMLTPEQRLKLASGIR